MTKIIYALLILLMSLAGCSGERGSRLPTAKLSSGSEGNPPNNSPSDPLRVCSPAENLDNTWEFIVPQEEMFIFYEGTMFEEGEISISEEDKNYITEEEKNYMTEEEREMGMYKGTKSGYALNDTTLLVIGLFRNNIKSIYADMITEVLVERLGCRPEEILYTFYKDCSSSDLLRELHNSYASEEETQVIRRILNERGETIPES
jgi:hypothetical protein